jgi:hypothetical protein
MVKILNSYKETIINFLKHNLPPKHVLKSFLFGSVVSDKIRPSDCDIFIVTNLTPLNSDWRKFIAEIENLKSNFLCHFQFPLNATINTENEYKEYSVFKQRVLNGPTIDLI